MKLHKISLRDKKRYAKFLNLSSHQLSCYKFENIYIWKKLFDIYWTVSDDCLCIFFQDKLGCFMYLPPLGKQIRPQLLDGSFRLMDKINRNCAYSRMENLEEEDAAFYRQLGYTVRFKGYDYLCSQSQMAMLKGEDFKSKRAAVNYFNKHYTFEYAQFRPQDKSACLKLYRSWMQHRRCRHQDALYQGMLLDNLACLEVLLADFRSLELIGRVIRIDGQVRGFSFGFALNKETFCILFEITDLSYKGLSQYIFQRFCAELKNYRYINIMDDSGLENLKRVKLSYRPRQLIPSYIISR